MMEVFTKIATIIIVKLLTILTKRFILDEWLLPVMVDKTQILKSKWRYLPGDAIILIDSLHLKFRSVNCLTINQPLKQLSEYWFKKSLKFNIKAPVAEFISGKVYAFSIFFQKPLGRYVWSMKIALWEASCFRCSNNLSSCLKLQKHHCKYFWKKEIRNESCKSCY